jgi:hypothetical protein
MTTVSKPIEKLIQDREQERAKQYWERIRRFKAQVEEQKSSREAHERRQLEYLRSAGIDLKKVESEQEEDARELKSYLEQKRPPLISRPKQASHVQIPPVRAGQVVPVYGVFLPPPAPPDPSDVPPTNTSQIKIKSVQDGTGSGWAYPPGAPPKHADVVYVFTPQQDASYTFTATLAFSGFYILKADDSWYNRKFATVSCNVWLDAFQYIDRGSKPFPDVLNKEGDNINTFENWDHFELFTDTQDFREGEPVVVTVTIEVEAQGCGAGSHGEVNFEDGDANFIQPLDLVVNPAP